MAKQPLQAIDYLVDPEQFETPPVCVVFGDESFLKGQVLLRIRQSALGGHDAEFALRTFDGQTVELRDVLDELSTVAMFGPGKRLVIIEQADDFVTENRSELEQYVEKPRRSGILVLEVTKWPENTRLSKAVAGSGLAVACRAPTAAKLKKWLCQWASQTHDVQLDSAGADVLVELVGPELGLLDQELAKLALGVKRGEKIDARHIRQTVGAWRARTVWEMLDATLDGNTKEALVQLDRLLLAGENPVGVLAQISASLRRLAAATQIVRHAERNGQKVPLQTALAQAGVPHFLLRKVQRQLTRLGRQRGEKMYGWLLRADLDMKGASAVAPRLVLERLITQVSSQPTEG